MPKLLDGVLVFFVGAGQITYWQERISNLSSSLVIIYPKYNFWRKTAVFQQLTLCVICRLAFLTCVSHTAHVIDIGRTSVHLSVTRWYCVETAQPIVKLSSLHGSPMILVFWGPDFSQNSNENTPNGGVKCKGAGKKCHVRLISRYSS